MNAFSDETLMDRVREDDLDPLGLLFERYHQAVFSFFVQTCGNRSISQDLVQDVFFRIINYRASYRSGAPFKPWLYRIARNVRADYLKKKASTNLSSEALREDQHPRHMPDSVQDEHNAEVYTVLRLLPEDKRELLVLSHVEQLSYTELAQIYEVSVNAVRIRVCRALQAFRALYTQSTMP